MGVIIAFARSSSVHGRCIYFNYEGSESCLRVVPTPKSARCVDFVYYYPIQPLERGVCSPSFCNSSLDFEYSVETLDDDSDLDRTYGVIESCADYGIVVRPYATNLPNLGSSSVRLSATV